MKNTPAYVTVSWVFLILTGIVLSYSCFFYPDTHPVNCIIKEKTGKDCPSCGFSRAFSSYTHFEFEKGKAFNPLSLAPFIFFSAQFFLRFGILLYFYLKRRIPSARFILWDILISISGFLLAFLPLLINF